jgi:branched-chain amino acid transport system permease protein
MTVLLQGLATGAVYVIIALGYNITLKGAGVLNFAFAQFVFVGAFLAAWGAGEHDLAWPVVFLLSVAVGAAVGLVVERLAIRPLPAADNHAELVTTVGVATILTGLLTVMFGSDPLRVPLLDVDPVGVAGHRVPVVDIVLVLISCALAFGLRWLLTHTHLGLASLARTQDREAAMLRGVDVRGLAILTFVLAGALAGLLGPLVGAKVFASVNAPLVLAVKGFIAMTLGGVGSFGGALAGGMIIGIVEAAAQYYLGVSYGNTAVFLAFLAALLIRPYGLFGRAEARAV